MSGNKLEKFLDLATAAIVAYYTYSEVSSMNGITGYQSFLYHSAHVCQKLSYWFGKAGLKAEMLFHEECDRERMN
jgi:hypothetical protein